MGAHALLAGALERSAEWQVSSPASLCTWTLDALAGRFVEIGGGPATASLTLCARLMREAQEVGGLIAWVGRGASAF